MARVILYHATRATFDRFDLAQTVDSGLHLGSEAQARMRGGPRAQLLRVEADLGRTKRCRDQGGNWKTRIQRARSEGYGSIVYLNRYEGLPLARVLDAQAAGVDLDRLSDAAFKKRVPEAEDSIIMLHANDLRILPSVAPEPTRRRRRP